MGFRAWGPGLGVAFCMAERRPKVLVGEHPQVSSLSLLLVAVYASKEAGKAFQHPKPESTGLV